MILRHILASICLSLCLTGAAQAQETGPEGCDRGETVITFSHVTAYTNNPKGDAAEELSDRVNREMNGRLCMQVYANSALFDDERVIEALLLGDVQLAAPSLSRLEAYTGTFRLFDLFFLFEDIDAVDRFQKSPIGQDMLASLDQYGMIGLAFWHSGMKQMSANRPLILPADMRGLRMRVQPSDILEESFIAFGASPQKLAFSEVLGALETNAVHGQENTWSNIYTQDFYTTQDSITETNHGVLDYILLMSVDFWNMLSPRDQTQFRQILGEVTDKYNNLVDKINEAARDALIARGVTIHTLTPEQREAWISVIRPHWESFLPANGRELIAAALAMQGKPTTGFEPGDSTAVSANTH